VAPMPCAAPVTIATVPFNRAIGTPSLPGGEDQD